MAKGKRTGIELTAYDDLFETDQSREEAALSKIRDIPLAEIDEFPDHPFKVLMDEDMEQLVDSIKRSGVMTPATVRLKEDGRYELISGHRRKKACDGGRIIISYAWGEKTEKTCRFIDEYHTEVGSSLYHICEFAEKMKMNGHSYEPKPEEPPSPRKAPKHRDHER